jgi:hypothetical protein
MKTFLAFNFKDQDRVASELLEEVMAVNESHWHWNSFRNCKMLSVYNPGGNIGKVDLLKKEKFTFTTPVLEKCPKLIEFLKNSVFKWMEPVGRVTILRTPPGVEMSTHIDCSLKEVGTEQYKWRFVLKGDISGLYFLDEKQEKVHIPDMYRMYILDGGHPHRIETSLNEKITICIGSPWKKLNGLNGDFEMTLCRPDIKTSWIDPALQ